MAVVGRQDADGRPALHLGPATGRLHDPAEAAAQDDRASLGQMPAHFLGCVESVGPGLAAADDTHIWPVGRHRTRRVLT
jgi:hypothetical protein